MNKKNIFILLISAICICSCDSSEIKSTDKDEQSLFIPMEDCNENIQNVFFGVQFGASKEKLIETFAEHNFYTEPGDELFYKVINGNIYSFQFENMEWMSIRVGMDNNRFNMIEFINFSDTKEGAIKKFNHVLSNVSSKYYMHDFEDNNPNIYKRNIGVGKNNCWVTVYCEHLGNEMYIVCLGYGEN